MLRQTDSRGVACRGVGRVVRPPCLIKRRFGATQAQNKDNKKKKTEGEKGEEKPSPEERLDEEPAFGENATVD